MLERVIKLSQNGTCVKTEILAGFTTFLTMAYIVALNPNLLTNFGAAGAALWNGVFLATCIASGLYWAGSLLFLGANPFASLETASFVPPFADMFSTTFFKFNVAGFLEIGWFTLITLVVTFCIIDMFDTIGTLVGTASRASMMDENGRMSNMKEALLSDAIGTITGACTGTSTVSTFIESAAGVEVGGRTGLTAVVTGLMFLLCMFLAPEDAQCRKMTKCAIGLTQQKGNLCA